MIDPNKRYIGILLASITAFFWGFLAIALKVAVNYIGPYAIVWFRFLLAFTVLFLFYIFRDPSRLKIMIRPPWMLVIAALCLGLNYIGFMQGINYTSPGNAQILIQLGPMLLAVVGILVYREALSKRQMAGFLLAGIGFMIFYHDQITNLLTDKEAFNIGVLFTVGGALCWVVYASFQKKLVQQWQAQQLNLMIYGLPAIIFLPLVSVSDFTGLAGWQWALLIFLGLNTLIAYGSLAAAFRYVEANKVSIIVTVNPVITFVVMTILAEMNVNWIEPEVITVYGFGGALLVLTGAIMAVMKSKKKQRLV